jgi:hypothetical protein
MRWWWLLPVWLGVIAAAVSGVLLYNAGGMYIGIALVLAAAAGAVLGVVGLIASYLWRSS